jgi:hypothetical protein
MSLESEVQENTRTMKALLAKMSGGTLNTPSAPAAAPGAEKPSFISDAFKPVADSLLGGAGAIETFVGKLVRQTAGIPDVAGVITAGITPMFGGLGKILGDAFGGTIEFVDESVKNWQNFSKLGPTMYGNAMNVNVAMGKMRLNYDDFSDVIKGMGGGGLAFGKSMSEATILFSQAVDNFAKSDLQKNFQMLGIKEKERADIMGVVIRGWTGLNLSSAEGMEAASKATDKLGKSMSLLAEITGVTREKQIDAMKEFSDDLRTYSAKEEHVLNGDYLYAELSKNVANAVKSAPAMLRDAAVQASSNNGQVYGPAQQTMNLLAPRTLAMIEMNGRIMGDMSRSEDERKKAAQNMEKAQLGFTAEIMTNSTRMFSKYDSLTAEQKATLKEIQPFREAVLNVIAESKGLKTMQQAIDEVQKTGAGVIEGKKTLPEGSGQPGLKPGEIDPGRESTMAYLNLQSRIKDLGEITTSTISKFNTESGHAGGAFAKFNEIPIVNSGKKFNDALDALAQKIMPEGGGQDAQILAPAVAGSHLFNQAINSANPKKQGDGGMSSAGLPTIFGELGFEYKADESAQRVYNNGQTKTLISSMTDGMRMFPILSSQLQKVAPEVAQVVSNAISESTSSSSTDQDSLITEIKKLNTTMEAVAGFTKGTVDGVKQTVRAIAAADSVY